MMLPDMSNRAPSTPPARRILNGYTPVYVGLPNRALQKGTFGLPACLISSVFPSYEPVRPNLESEPLGQKKRPWILERRNSTARHLQPAHCGRPVFGRQVAARAQWYLNTMISASGYLAFSLVFGSDPVDLYGWDDREEDLLFAQDTSVSGQFAQEWELRRMAHEAASKEVANSGLRSLSTYNKTFSCADVEIGDGFFRGPEPGVSTRIVGTYMYPRNW